MPYFDTAEATDLAYLPADLRDADGIERIAGEAEADVLEHYTRELPTRRGTAFDPMSSAITTMVGRTYTELDSYRGVFLRHYTVDPANCTSEAFKAAMKRTIAAVIRWRLAQENANQLVQSESGAAGASSSKSVTKYPDAREPFPPRFSRWLAGFDTREPLSGFG